MKLEHQKLTATVAFKQQQRNPSNAMKQPLIESHWNGFIATEAMNCNNCSDAAAGVIYCNGSIATASMNCNNCNVASTEATNCNCWIATAAMTLKFCNKGAAKKRTANVTLQLQQ